MNVTIYTDGACRGNPGNGGYGVIIQYENGTSEEYSKGFVETTNNRMELLAAIVGLENIDSGSNVTLYSDSKYLVDAFNQNWIPSWIKKGWKNSKKEHVKNVDLWQRLLLAKSKHENVKFVWVKGHASNEFNNRCDKLATESADNILLEDYIKELKEKE